MKNHSMTLKGIPTAHLPGYCSPGVSPGTGRPVKPVPGSLEERISALEAENRDLRSKIEEMECIQGRQAEVLNEYRANNTNLARRVTIIEEVLNPLHRSITPPPPPPFAPSQGFYYQGYF